ncbi:MAG: beta-N-acetylhexosaminidase [Bacteroidota bacterium]
MKSFFLFFFFFLSSLIIRAQQPALYPVIPKPTALIPASGTFSLSNKVIIINNSEVMAEAKYLQAYLESHYGIITIIKPDDTPTMSSNTSYQTVYMRLANNARKLQEDESYTLDVTPKSIIISSQDPAGVFYGIQSLIQLIPANTPLHIPCANITDSPAYKWRGMHLDCCRHFFTKEEVKKYIDYLAFYKLNTFHWHLTDDQGWRIEIKKYPKLTTIASQRKQTLVGRPGKKNVYDGKPYGGFYSQEDIKEIIAYAATRHVTIVPEIEMPGHALAALAAYPEYSCKGGNFEVGDTWGVYDDVFCAGNDGTLTFMEDILAEVCALFPGKYIHVGGDECPKERWKTCPKCQTRIKKENLKDEHALQSYFITHIEKFVNSNGKQIIGWDEILEGGLAPNAAVMSWQGTEGGIIAAKQKHFAVMTPGKPCYFDHYQVKDNTNEPLAIGGFNPLDSVYNYKPVPAALTADEKQFILGAQGNVWTEYISDFKQVEYMSVPRMIALAEALWTPIDQKNYTDFISRLTINAKLLDKMKVNYARHFLKQP